MEVNSVPATCTGPDSVCAFAYADDHTPTVSTVSPNSVTITAAPMYIQIYGTGFHAEAALNAPLIDDEPCLDVSMVAAGRLRCRLPYGIKGGSRLVGRLPSLPRPAAQRAAPSAALLATR